MSGASKGPINFTTSVSFVGYDEVIERLGHLPQSWIEK